MAKIDNAELKSIYVSSVFKFFGGIFLIVGLIVGLFANVFKIEVISPEMTAIFPFLANIRPGIVAGILFGIIYGLSAAIGFSVLAALYNFFAAVMGGLKVSVKEE